MSLSEITRRLIAAGASVNVAEQNGRTPLHHAAGRGNLELVRLLVLAGADITVAEKELGLTPLAMADRQTNPLAVGSHFEEVADYLRSRAAIP